MRINLFAGPGAGKSALAYWLVGELKSQGASVELASEYVKEWAYQSIPPTRKFDQLYLFSKQIRKELIPIRDGDIKHIISDSPILLAGVYAKRLGEPYYNQLFEISDMIDAEFPSVNIFLDRVDGGFKQEGRYHDLEQSKKIDNEIRQLLDERHMGYQVFSVLNRKTILEYICRIIMHDLK